MTSFGTVFVRIPCDDPRETIVHGCGAERKTASEAFGKGVQTFVIESAVGTDHGFGYVTRYIIGSHPEEPCTVRREHGSEIGDVP